MNDEAPKKERTPDQLTMVYRAPGPHKIEGHAVDYMTTDNIDAAKKDGWCLTVDLAVAGVKKAAKK